MRIESNTSIEESERLRQAMTSYLAGRGLTLRQVFVESDGSASSEFASLIDALRSSDATAVIVPSIGHFARIEGVGIAMTKLIEDQTGACVLFIETPQGRDNPMSNSVRRDPDLVLISELCRELAKLGLNVGMSDARPAAVIHHSPESLWITVDPSGEFFEWREGAEHRHPVTDPSCAAALIFQYVKRQRSGPGEVS